MVVQKSVVIRAPLQRAHSAVRDFHQWTAWSPWIIAEPDATLTYSEDGRGYGWDGRIVGKGGMIITEEEMPRAIHYRLTFLRPWKSESVVRFLFAEHPDGVEVTWTMDGSLPFFLFWMKTMMTAFVGMDYQRGLAMLKDLLETGNVPSKLKFLGRQQFPGCPFIGIKTACNIVDLGAQMRSDFERLNVWCAENRSRVTGAPFAVYHRWDPIKSECEYTLGAPMADASGELPQGFRTGTLPACDTYAVQHAGAYRHLGNAWAAGMMHARAKVFRQNKRIHPFEVYQDDAQEVPETQRVTVVHFPAK